ncbi:UNKNOWN [Stylonychia lemnae]|uniref:Uncharacterized protein n=1 Tax=Stylonychia lemnae TaxID=5949 RepID=A0A078BEV1_STYLE|nr:UNKNOWN [Stylonychia lemnae]|eukprot:CDW91692.1 UNKNOWN [Stylonychia lemnae]
MRQLQQQSTPRKSLSNISSRLREETISSSIKKFTKSVKFTNEEKAIMVTVTKKPSGSSPRFGSNQQNTQFQSSFSGAATRNNLAKENQQNSNFLMPIPKQLQDLRRNVLNDTSFNVINQEPQSQIELFKSSNFSLIELMKKSQPTQPKTINPASNNLFNQMLADYKLNNSSQISTPRLTPLKMLERNRSNVVSKDDINKLEDKIKDLEDQIFNAKKKGEETKKLDILEQNLKKTDLSFIEESSRVNKRHQSKYENEIINYASSEEDLLDEDRLLLIQQTPHVLHNFSEQIEEDEQEEDPTNQEKEMSISYSRGRRSLDNQASTRMSLSRYDRRNESIQSDVEQITLIKKVKDNQLDNEEFDCSQFDLQQSFNQVFGIIKQFKIDPVHKQQLRALQIHIQEQINFYSEENNQNKRRFKKSCRKPERNLVLTENNMLAKLGLNENTSARSSINPFDHQSVKNQSLSRTRTKSDRDIMIQMVTRSQKKRKRRNTAVQEQCIAEENPNKRRKI